jgi:hypothetical protein
MPIHNSIKVDFSQSSSLAWNAPGKWIANHWIEASDMFGEDAQHHATMAAGNISYCGSDDAKSASPSSWLAINVALLILCILIKYVSV